MSIGKLVLLVFLALVIYSIAAIPYLIGQGSLVYASWITETAFASAIEMIKMHKVISLIFLLILIILGFISWELSTTIMSSIFVAVISLNFFDNKIIPLLLIVSGILWGLTNEDFGRELTFKSLHVYNIPDRIQHFIKYVIGLTFYYGLVYYSTGYWTDHIAKNSEYFNKHMFLLLLIVVVPVIIYGTILYLQCKVFNHGLFNLVNDKFEEIAGTNKIWYGIAIFRMVCMGLILLIVFMNFSKLELSYIIGLTVVCAFSVSNTVRRMVHIAKGTGSY